MHIICRKYGKQAQTGQKTIDINQNYDTIKSESF